MKFNKLFLAVISTAFFASCSSDDDSQNQQPLGAYDDGVLVVNEGSSTTGSITYLSNDLATIQQNVFSLVNGSESMGGYVQSMFFDGDKAYIASGGADKLTIVNRYTMAYIGAVSTGLVNPRYGVVYNGKAYVTCANDFGSATDDYVAVINLGTLAVEDPIAINDYAERIVEKNGKLYVADSGFGSGTNVTVVDAATKSIVTVLNVGVSPNSMEEKDGTLYVLCGSFTDSSKLVRINTANNTIIDSVTMAGSIANAQNLDLEGNKIYFTAGAKIYSNTLNVTTIEDMPIIDTGSAEPFIGYGFGVHNGRIYISQAASDFSSDGKVFVYSTSGGAAIDEFTVGLGPNSFYFNE
jgi:hypothetical protein